MIHLKPDDLIGRGRTRACYRHPHNPDQCIKIDHQKSGGATAKEAAYYEKLPHIPPNLSYTHIPRYHGIVETNLGRGWIFDLICDETDGQISKSLRDYILAGNISKDDPVWNEAHTRYLEILFNEAVIIRDFHPGNISVRCKHDGSYQFISIDGIGHHDFLPLCDFIPWLARWKLKRQLRRKNFTTLEGILRRLAQKPENPSSNLNGHSPVMGRHAKSYKVCVATLTRQRKQMLTELLISWQQMMPPDSVELSFLVVENDVDPHSKEVVEQMAEGFPEQRPLHYVLETELGIPFGRNRAAWHAIENGCDLLAFVDDDEVVARDWLIRMMMGYREGHAVLLGAPLRIAPIHDGGDHGPWQKIMHRNVAYRYERKEKRAARLANINETPRVTIVTNNWLGELDLFRPDGHGLSFDESMRFTGGTDAKFHAEVKKRGLVSGWVKDAFVYETVPASRLSFRYQLKRARDQSTTHTLRTMRERCGSRPLLLLKIIVKAIGLLLLCLIAPFTLTISLLPIARNAGWLLGAGRAVFGFRSDLYREVTGE